MSIKDEKLQRVLACPNCKKPKLVSDAKNITCQACGESYSLFFGTPILIKAGSPVFEWYQPRLASRESRNQSFQRLQNLYWWLRPEARVWTKLSQRILQELVDNVNPDSDDTQIILLGAGFETAFKRILEPYENIIRIGLASQGEVDFFSDACEMPLQTNSIDLIMSSSVLEHVYDIEKAVIEMNRAIKPGGFVYAEIPFMRAYHMIPIDYQRFTISGIEKLFERNGFKLVNKGICSGPFTAATLFIIDFLSSFFYFNKFLRAVVTLILSILLHPVKFIDRLFENSEWAEITACNFFYVGEKIDNFHYQSKTNCRND